MKQTKVEIIVSNQSSLVKSRHSQEHDSRSQQKKQKDPMNNSGQNDLSAVILQIPINDSNQLFHIGSYEKQNKEINPLSKDMQRRNNYLSTLLNNKVGRNLSFDFKPHQLNQNFDVGFVLDHGSNFEKHSSPGKIALDPKELTMISQSIGTGASGERMRNLVNEMVAPQGRPYSLGSTNSSNFQANPWTYDQLHQTQPIQREKNNFSGSNQRTRGSRNPNSYKQVDNSSMQETQLQFKFLEKELTDLRSEIKKRRFGSKTERKQPSLINFEVKIPPPDQVQQPNRRYKHDINDPILQQLRENIKKQQKARRRDEQVSQSLQTVTTQSLDHSSEIINPKKEEKEVFTLQKLLKNPEKILNELTIPLGSALKMIQSQERALPDTSRRERYLNSQIKHSPTSLPKIVGRNSSLYQSVQFVVSKERSQFIIDQISKDTKIELLRKSKNDGELLRKAKYEGLKKIRRKNSNSQIESSSNQDLVNVINVQERESVFLKHKLQGQLVNKSLNIPRSINQASFQEEDDQLTTLYQTHQHSQEITFENSFIKNMKSPFLPSSILSPVSKFQHQTIQTDSQFDEAIAVTKTGSDPMVSQTYTSNMISPLLNSGANSKFILTQPQIRSAINDINKKNDNSETKNLKLKLKAILSDQPFVYIPQNQIDSNTHKKKKANENLADQIKKLESRLKEKKREIEKKQFETQIIRDEYQKHFMNTQRIQHFALVQASQEENIIKKHDEVFDHNATDQNSMEHSFAQIEVDQLYRNLYRSDLTATKIRTQDQVTLQQNLQEKAELGIINLRQENTRIKKMIKIMKHLTDEHMKIKKENARNKSEFETSSFNLNESQSYASTSQFGSLEKSLDLSKVEKISAKVQAIVNSKTPIDCMLTVLKTIKESFKSASRISIFVVNKMLQAIIFNGEEKNSRFFRSIQTIDKKTVYAIYLSEKESCNPCFQTIEKAKKLYFQQRIMSVPVFDKRILWFTIQIEADEPAQGKRAIVRKMTKVNSMIKKTLSIPPSQPQALNRRKTVISHSNSFQSARRGTISWSINDQTVSRLIAEIARARVQNFVHLILIKEKSKMKGHVVDFITKYMKLKTTKACLQMIETDLPRLLGYGKSCVFLHNEKQDLLYSVCLDEEADNLKKLNGPPGFERDFIIEEGQVVEFPIDMGITGFTKKHNAICYINKLQEKLQNIAKPTLANCFCIDKIQMTFFGQYILSKGITEKQPFDNQIDNFLALDVLENAVFVSLQDEDIIKMERPIGVLQLFNRVASEITQEDLRRLFYLRKLIGSQTQRVHAIEDCLKALVAIGMHEDIVKKFDDGTKVIIQSQMENHAMIISQHLSTYERTLCETESKF